MFFSEGNPSFDVQSPNLQATVEHLHLAPLRLSTFHQQVPWPAAGGWLFVTVCRVCFAAVCVWSFACIVDCVIVGVDTS